MTTTSHQVPSPILLSLLIHLLIPLASTTPDSPMLTSPLQVSFQVHLEHLSSRSNLTKMQIIQRTIKLEGLATPAAAPSPSANFQSRVLQTEGEFVMNLSIGTPPRYFSAIMDTGSSMVWTQCMPCKSCYVQPTPIFNPNTSSTFSPLPCSSYLCGPKTRRCETNLCRYRTIYGDMSFTQGYLATETFTLGDSFKNVSIPNVAFGCGDNNAGTGLDIVAGIVGLGRGPLSLVSQLKPKKFSYRLPALGEKKKGTLSFGSLADKGCNASNNSKGTPLLRSPLRPWLYYVSLEGISLDDTLLPIPKSTFKMKTDGSGGMILDSGTTLTYLVHEAYQLLRVEFVMRLQTMLPVVSSPFTGLDLCFRMPSGKSASSITFPKLKFHFKDMVLELPKENYMVDDVSTRLVCLGIMPSLGGSIFGSLQQQNFLVLHDLENQIVSFPTQCA